MPVAYAIIHEQNGVFGVSFPDFPGRITGGDTEENAIRKALTFHVSGMVEDCLPLPAQMMVTESGWRFPFQRTISFSRPIPTITHALKLERFATVSVWIKEGNVIQFCCRKRHVGRRPPPARGVSSDPTRGRSRSLR
jgi:predicted RNase H-like HicB family nuclease